MDNLYLVGFMGSGKSSVGRVLARLLNRPFVDMDARLEKRLGLPIPQIFASLGEEAFRQAEHRLLRSLANRQGLVVATGGGVPVREENRRLMMASGRIVHLDVGLEACIRRLDPEDAAQRPLWSDRRALEQLWQLRRPVYAQSHLSIPAESGAEDTARRIRQQLFPDSTVATVQGSPVVCTWEPATAPVPFVQDGRAVILTDRTVARLHLSRYRAVLPEAPVIVVAPGERSKSLRTAQFVYEKLLQERINRGDTLVALGGGVVTDLGGFVAGTYKRGMRFVLVATTLLGCVDAAVGGKTGVNLGHDKNAVGVFRLPQAVVLDIAALATLPRRRVVEGLVEAYKTGLVADRGLAAFVEQETTALLRRDLAALYRLAAMAAAAKARIVARDFEESGARRVLNFGHTFGHVLEGWSRYRVSHGAAVAAGMIVAARLSRNRDLLSADRERRIRAALQRMIALPDGCPTATEAWSRMANDKKAWAGRIVWVLLEESGQVHTADDLSAEELGDALKVLEEPANG